MVLALLGFHQAPSVAKGAAIVDAGNVSRRWELLTVVMLQSTSIISDYYGSSARELLARCASSSARTRV